MIDATSGPTAMSATHQALRRAADELETTFLTEMLKSAGMGQGRDSFGGGVGEGQFASLLLEEQARAMVRAGGLNLADHLYDSLLKDQAHDT